jgi:opacity protein-like surface antigen
MSIMRKIAFSIILGGLLTTSLYAQRSYLGLSFGASLPSEEFAKKNLAEDGGYALPGFVIEFSGAYIFDYYFGIAGTFTFSSNPPDRDQLQKDLIDAITGPVPPEIEDVIFNHGSWMYSNLMAGPFVTIPIAFINLDFRAVAGLSILLSPPWELTVKTTEETYFTSRSGSTASFAYMLGTGIRFNINSSYAIRVAGDYFHSKPTFSVNEDSGVGGATEKSTYDMSVGTVNLSLGIAYRF